MVRLLAIRLLFAAALSVGIVGLPAPAARGGAVDPVHSSVLFRIKHLNTSFAWGRFNDFSGQLDLDGPNPSVDVQIKSESVDTGNVQRDQHLKGPDFFNVKQFPTIAFKATQVQPAGEGKYNLSGVLSLHGIERPLNVELVRTGSGLNMRGAQIVGYEANFKINRSDYGMKFLLGPLADEVLLIVCLECAAR